MAAYLSSINCSRFALLTCSSHCVSDELWRDPMVAHLVFLLFPGGRALAVKLCLITKVRFSVCVETVFLDFTMRALSLSSSILAAFSSGEGGFGEGLFALFRRSNNASSDAISLRSPRLCYS